MLADDNTSDREIHACLMRGSYKNNSAFDKYEFNRSIFQIKNISFSVILNICFVNYNQVFGVNNH